MTDDLSTKALPRRQFLKIAGCGAVVAVIGAGCSRTDQAEASCPHGMTDDPYPGQCRRYIDLNGDGYCDLSIASTPTAQSAAESQTGASQPASATAIPATAIPAATEVQASATATPAATATNVPASATPTSQSTTGIVSSQPVAPTNRGRGGGPGGGSGRCDRRCSYPGHCDRFSDSNGTGICDRSEA